MTVYGALNRLAKWRVLLTGWQLGTRPKTDPEGQAVRDHREVTLLLRAEVSALVVLLIKNELITQAAWEEALSTEATQLEADFAARFPGVRATPEGLVMDLPVIQRAGWMAHWKP